MKMEEAIHNLRRYLPIDFGNEENNDYMHYLMNACVENYENEKYQFSLMAYHMLFMAFLYKEFWELKAYSFDRVAALCRANGRFNNISQIFDASLISEKDFMDGFFGVFSWHPNKKSTYKAFVDQRDNCAHNSGFIQYEKDDVDSYFSDVLRNVEKVSVAAKESLISVYTASIVNYIKGPSFANTTTVDFLSREIAEKKYSYRDISTILGIQCPEEIAGESEILAYQVSLVFWALQMEEGDYSIELSSQKYIDDLSAFMNGIPLEQREKTPRCNWNMKLT